MDLETNFVIPNKPEDLLDWKKDGKYYVTDHYNAGELDPGT
jgi:hypothetical protein